MYRDNDKRLGPRGWFIIYLIAAIILILIIAWLAMSKGTKTTVNVHNGSERLEIVEGIEA